MFLSVDFGPEWGGQSLVGYKLLDSQGNETLPRTTTGVFSIGGGSYGASVAVPSNFEGVVYWDTAPGSLIYASESIRGPVVFSEPAADPEFGAATQEEWIAYMAAWSVNRVEADDNTGEVRLRKRDNSGNVAVHAVSDIGGVFVNDRAQ